MSNKLPKKEKLKSFRIIDNLFASGNHVFSHPIKIIYLKNTNTEEIELNKVGFTVSKKKFKHAVKRNLLKRRMREAYRKNKPTNIKNYNFMIVYAGNKAESYQLIEAKLKECFSKIKSL